jgi:hypothetical protein
MESSQSWVIKMSKCVNQTSQEYIKFCIHCLWKDPKDLNYAFNYCWTFRNAVCIQIFWTFSPYIFVWIFRSLAELLEYRITLIFSTSLIIWFLLNFIRCYVMFGVSVCFQNSWSRSILRVHNDATLQEFCFVELGICQRFLAWKDKTSWEYNKWFKTRRRLRL